MRTLRASSLPLALACPASQVPPQTRLADDSPESRLGSAVHEALAAMVRGEYLFGAAERAAASWRADPEEVRQLVFNGERCWDRLKGYFLNPQVEAELAALSDDREFLLTGHVDVGFVDDDCVTILDWKSGFADEDHEQQLRAYAWLALRDVLAGGAVAFLVRLREMTVDKYEWSRAELDAWHAGVVRDTADVERFRAGRHCKWCGRRDECEYRGDALAMRLSVILRGADSVPRLASDALVAGYDRLRMIESACEDVREAIRGEVAICGGSVTASDGRTLALVRQERREVNAARAWPLLVPIFGEKELLKSVTIRKDKSKRGEPGIETLAMDAAPRGKKTAAAKELMEQLDNAGAITVTTQEQLKVSRNGNCNERAIEAGDAAVSRPAITAPTTGAGDDTAT